jgi:hypothetical protein
MPNPHEQAPRPNLQVAARVEELLREQLEELGVNPRKLAPEEIAANMHCHLAPNGSMTYIWKGEPMLHVTPEKLVDENGEESVLWRMFTKDDLAEDNEAGTYDSFLMDAADCACEDDDDDEPSDAAPTAQ